MIYETGQYQIVAVVKTHVKEKDESGFRYYWFRNYKNRKEFQNLLDFVEENRVYDTGEHSYLWRILQSLPYILFAMTTSLPLFTVYSQVESIIVVSP